MFLWNNKIYFNCVKTFFGFLTHRHTWITIVRKYFFFRIELLIGACAVLAFLATYNKWEILHICKYFSVILETFAILPQIQFTSNAKYAGSSLVFYIGMLVFYRCFYVVHWSYLYVIKHEIHDVYIVLSGTLQFIIYCHYFVTLVPIFKSQYAKCENTCNSQINIAGVVANGTDDNPKKSEPLLSDMVDNLRAV